LKYLTPTCWFKVSRPPRIVGFDEAVGLLDQNFFGELGMTEEMEGLRIEPKAQRIALLAPPVQQDL